MYLSTFLQVTDKKKTFFLQKNQQILQYSIYYTYFKVNIFSVCRGVEVAICSMIVKNLLTSYSKLLLVNCLVI